MLDRLLRWAKRHLISWQALVAHVALALFISADARPFLVVPFESEKYRWDHYDLGIGIESVAPRNASLFRNREATSRRLCQLSTLANSSFILSYSCLLFVPITLTIRGTWALIAVTTNVLVGTLAAALSTFFAPLYWEIWEPSHQLGTLIWCAAHLTMACGVATLWIVFWRQWKVPSIAHKVSFARLCSGEGSCIASVLGVVTFGLLGLLAWLASPLVPSSTVAPPYAHLKFRIRSDQSEETMYKIFAEVEPLPVEVDDSAAEFIEVVKCNSPKPGHTLFGDFYLSLPITLSAKQAIGEPLFFEAYDPSGEIVDYGQLSFGYPSSENDVHMFDAIAVLGRSTIWRVSRVTIFYGEIHSGAQGAGRR